MSDYDAGQSIFRKRVTSLRTHRDLSSLVVSRASTIILTFFVMQGGPPRFARWLLCGWLSLGAIDVARADEQVRIALKVEASTDSECSTEAALRTRLASERESNAALMRVDEQMATRRIRVRFVRAEREGEWRAHMTLEESATDRVLGEREVSTHGSCAQLDELVSVVVGTFLGLHDHDHESVAEQPILRPQREPEQPHESTASPHEVAPSDATDRSIQAPQRPREHKLFAGLGVLAGVGPLPGAGFGVEGSLLLRWRSLLIALGAQALPRSTQDLGDGAQARFTAWLGRVQACGEVARGEQVGLSLCLGGRAGALQASTRGLAKNRTNTGLLSELLLGLRLTAQRTERLGFYGEVLATLPLRATRFYFLEGDGAERLYHQSEAGVTGTVGLLLRIGQ